MGCMLVVSTDSKGDSSERSWIEPCNDIYEFHFHRGLLAHTWGEACILMNPYHYRLEIPFLSFVNVKQFIYLDMSLDEAIDWLVYGKMNSYDNRNWL